MFYIYICTASVQDVSYKLYKENQYTFVHLQTVVIPYWKFIIL